MQRTFRIDDKVNLIVNNTQTFLDGIVQNHNNILGDSNQVSNTIRGSVYISDSTKTTLIKGLLTVNEQQTFVSNVTMNSNLFVKGNTTLGDQNTDLNVIRGTVNISDTTKTTTINGLLHVLEDETHEGYIRFNDIVNVKDKIEFGDVYKQQYIGIYHEGEYGNSLLVRGGNQTIIGQGEGGEQLQTYNITNNELNEDLYLIQDKEIKFITGQDSFDNRKLQSIIHNDQEYEFFEEPTFRKTINLIDSNLKLSQYTTEQSFEILNTSGFVRLGQDLSKDYLNIKTDKQEYYFNKNIWVDGRIGIWDSENKNIFISQTDFNLYGGNIEHVTTFNEHIKFDTLDNGILFDLGQDISKIEFNNSGLDFILNDTDKVFNWKSDNGSTTIMSLNSNNNTLTLNGNFVISGTEHRRDDIVFTEWVSGKGIRWVSKNNSFSDYQFIRYYQDQSEFTPTNYDIYSDSSENGTLIIGVENDVVSTVGDQIVLRTGQRLIVDQNNAGQSSHEPINITEFWKEGVKKQSVLNDGTYETPQINLTDSNTRLTRGDNYSLKITTPTGWVDIGSGNTGYTHFYSDRPRFYFDKPIDVNNEIKIYSTNYKINESLQNLPTTTINGNLTITGNTVLGNQNTDQSTIRGTLTLSDQGKTTTIKGSTIINENLTVNGNTTIGNQNSDTLTVNSDTTFKDDVKINKTVTIDQTLHTIGEQTFDDNVNIQGSLNLSGNLNIIGQINQQSVNNLTVDDTFITLNEGETGQGVTLGTSGIEIDRGTQSNVKFYWDENEDKFKLYNSDTTPIPQTLEQGKVLSRKTSTFSQGLNLTNTDYSNQQFDVSIPTHYSDVVKFDNWNNLKRSSDNETLTHYIQQVTGGMVSSNTEKGINVTFDQTNRKLDFDVNDFTLTLNGDVSGNQTITDLSDTTLTVSVHDNSHKHNDSTLDSISWRKILSRPSLKVNITGQVTGNQTIDLDDVGDNGLITFNIDQERTHIHDDRYYTESEQDQRFVNVTGDTVTGTFNFNNVGTQFDIKNRTSYSTIFRFDQTNSNINGQMRLEQYNDTEGQSSSYPVLLIDRKNNQNEQGSNIQFRLTDVNNNYHEYQGLGQVKVNDNNGKLVFRIRQNQNDRTEQGYFDSDKSLYVNNNIHQTNTVYQDDLQSTTQTIQGLEISSYDINNVRYLKFDQSIRVNDGGSKELYITDYNGQTTNTQVIQGKFRQYNTTNIQNHQQNNTFLKDTLSNNNSKIFEEYSNGFGIFYLNNNTQNVTLGSVISDGGSSQQTTLFTRQGQGNVSSIWQNTTQVQQIDHGTGNIWTKGKIETEEDIRFSGKQKIYYDSTEDGIVFELI